jgi:hypothetical protein
MSSDTPRRRFRDVVGRRRTVPTVLVCAVLPVISGVQPIHNSVEQVLARITQTAC